MEMPLVDLHFHGKLSVYIFTLPDVDCSFNFLGPLKSLQKTLLAILGQWGWQFSLRVQLLFRPTAGVSWTSAAHNDALGPM